MHSLYQLRYVLAHIGGVDLVAQNFTGCCRSRKRRGFSAYQIMWRLDTLVLIFDTLRLNRALQVVFGSLTILFCLLAIGDAVGNEAISRVTGWEGLACGFSAMYADLAKVLNKVYGLRICPLGLAAKEHFPSKWICEPLSV